MRSRQPRVQRRASLIAECLTRGWLAPLWGFETSACFEGACRWRVWTAMLSRGGMHIAGLALP